MTLDPRKPDAGSPAAHHPIEGGGAERIDVRYTLTTADGRPYAALVIETVVEDGRRVACTIFSPTSLDPIEPRRADHLVDAEPIPSRAGVQELASHAVPAGSELREDGPPPTSVAGVEDSWSRAVLRDPTHSSRVTALAFGSATAAREALVGRLQEQDPGLLTGETLPHGTETLEVAAGWTGLQSDDMGPYLASVTLLVGSGLVKVAVLDIDRADAQERAQSWPTGSSRSPPAVGRVGAGSARPWAPDLGPVPPSPAIDRRAQGVAGGSGNGPAPRCSPLRVGRPTVGRWSWS